MKIRTLIRCRAALTPGGWMPAGLASASCLVVALAVWAVPSGDPPGLAPGSRPRPLDGWELMRRDLFRAGCSALAEQPECAALGEVVAAADRFFGDPKVFPVILNYLANSDLPTVRAKLLQIPAGARRLEQMIRRNGGEVKPTIIGEINRSPLAESPLADAARGAIRELPIEQIQEVIARLAALDPVRLQEILDHIRRAILHRRGP